MRLLFDPNPQAEEFSFGRIEIFDWKDTNDIEWQGGLITPPDYVAGSRYPLIIQTHGFRPDMFLVDGPGGDGATAMAAQAFANADFIVLQVQDNHKAFTNDEREGPRFAEGLRAGIEKLASLGMVDQRKVGLIGFSRTGYQALHVLSRHPKLIAAVTIADAVQMSYSEYIYSAINSADSARLLQRMAGGSPDFQNPGEWFGRNPVYKLPRADAALRLEANGAASFVALWETYAVLRNANRPVEYVFFPEGSHVLRKPAERLASQGGNVDWFRFWLQDYEDLDPAKADQYSRWRRLRRGESARDESQSMPPLGAAYPPTYSAKPRT